METNETIRLVESDIGALANAFAFCAGICEPADFRRAVGRLTAWLWDRNIFIVPRFIAPKG